MSILIKIVLITIVLMGFSLMMMRPSADKEPGKFEENWKIFGGMCVISLLIEVIIWIIIF